MKEVFALHHINHAGQLPFDAGMYSRFKFGGLAEAMLMGRELGQALVRQYRPQLLESSGVVVVPSPYLSIPTASFYLTHWMSYEINRLLAQNGRPAVTESKIYRKTTYSEDYGYLNAEERLRLINNDEYYTDAQLLNDRLVIYTDDVKITGSHQKVIERMQERLGISGGSLFAYYARLANADIPPSIENHLNYYEISNWSGIDALIRQNNFVFNTRVIKFILSLTPGDWQAFTSRQSEAWLRQMHQLALSNNYHLMEAYAGSMNLLTQLLH